jgi:hypothetical protein
MHQPEKGCQHHTQPRSTHHSPYLNDEIVAIACTAHAARAAAAQRVEGLHHKPNRTAVDAEPKRGSSTPTRCCLGRRLRATDVRIKQRRGRVALLRAALVLKGVNGLLHILRQPGLIARVVRCPQHTIGLCAGSTAAGAGARCVQGLDGSKNARHVAACHSRACRQRRLKLRVDLAPLPTDGLKRMRALLHIHRQSGWRTEVVVRLRESEKKKKDGSTD